MPAKTVLVTGCTDGGAGAALALEFHRRGHVVFATSTDGTRMDSLSNTSITTLPLNLTSRPSIDKAAATVAEATGGSLDMLVNNAGAFEVMPLADVDVDRVRKLYEVNTFGVIQIVQGFLPLLIKADGAMFANVGSISGVMCPAWQGVYASSKAAAMAMCNVLRLELAPFNVRVVNVVSGGVNTAGIQRSKNGNPLPDGSLYKSIARSIETNEAGSNMKMPSPEEYAKQVVDDLLQEKPKPMIWRGGFSFLSWLTTWLGWVGMMDGGQIERSGLNKIKNPEDVKNL